VSVIAAVLAVVRVVVVQVAAEVTTTEVVDVVAVAEVADPEKVATTVLAVKFLTSVETWVKESPLTGNCWA
jgi:uncharacterized protein with GYD domain